MSSTLPTVDPSLADFATTAANLVKQSGSTAYSYAFSADGSVTQPTNLAGVDGVPMVDLTDPAGAYAYTDCSGWMSFALDSVAPLHQAVAAAERALPEFNNSASDQTGTVAMNEAADWGWARADVLAQLFSTATGANGFAQVPFTALQSGDIIAYAQGIYADPTGDPTTDKSLGDPLDTGHTMVVVGTPTIVTDPETTTGITGLAGMSSAVVTVYAVQVVDSSSLYHFISPEADSRSYDIPDGTPDWLGAQKGGLGTGTIWFGVDASGKVVQFRFADGDHWKPSQTGDTTYKLLVTAGRLTGTVDITAAAALEQGTLTVRVYPNATPVLGDTSYAMPELLSGTGNLLVTGGGTLSLGAGNTFTGSTEVANGTILTLAADTSLGAAGNALTLDDGSTLRLASAMTLTHTLTLGGAATLDLSGNVVDLSAALGGAGTSVLTLSSSTSGGELQLDGDASGLDTVVVQDGAALTFAAGIGGAPAAVVLESGATLNVDTTEALSSLLVSGNATLNLANGARLSVSSGLAAGFGGFGALTVTGNGELDLANGAAPVTAGQTVFTGTLAQLDGQDLTAFKANDVIDVSGLNPVHAAGYTGTGVTAQYDNTTGTLTVSQDGQSAVLNLSPGLEPVAVDGTHAEFTVSTDGAGGTLLANVGSSVRPTAPDATTASGPTTASGTTTAATTDTGAVAPAAAVVSATTTASAVVSSTTVASTTPTVSGSTGSAIAGSIRVAGPNGILAAGTGADTLVAGGAGVQLVAGSGQAQLIGAESGASTLTGGTGNTVFVARGGPTLVQGGTGHDTVQATTGALTVLGGTAGSLVGLGSGAAVVASQGADTIMGGVGSSLIAARGPGVTVFAGAGASMFVNGAGASVFVGGTGSATVFAGAGGGTVSGGTAGNNVLVGGQGAATLFGGGTGDALFATGAAGTTLVAGRGNETLQGAASSGNDTFFAGSGTTLIGLGSGQDTVVAGAGNATVLGGTGADTFLVANGQAGGMLTVYGFKAGVDHLSLAGFDANEPARALASTVSTVPGTAGAGGTTITLSDQTRINLVGVQSLDRSAFA